MKSYFVDTNYFLRLFVKDNIEHHRQAYLLFQQALQGKIEIYSSSVVFFEVYWVLSKIYKYDKIKTISFLLKILKMDFLKLEQRDVLKQSLHIFVLESIDLEDCYNIAYYKTNSLSEFATFDKKLLNVINR